ncbi:hypothetical protein BX661DRAFT_177927 [Kickxella alabastrina]|uniref:uncharacterized protein n=1 Tax=Kickxella alabastrina TaxID=61397 RepID=UPI0022205FFC|nr:uncharacterized protein BX661DRAFT_177927 [Kickxella alabastrina]KAI7833210.1 hypothetical protein BX661DRAFT_177927 [Kickxella alabastrina]
MPLMTFKTPERVSWNDDASGHTFFIVVKSDTTSKWRANPKMPLDEVVYSNDILCFKGPSAGISLAPSSGLLQTAFKTTDKATIIKSILSVGTIAMSEFELDVDSQTTNAINAASSVANVASGAATNALEGMKGYLSSFW